MALSLKLKEWIGRESERAKKFKVNLKHLSPIEQRFVEHALSKSWLVQRPSWPDFLIDIGGEIIAVEVKSYGDRISSNQRRTFDLLEEIGVKVYLWYQQFPKRLIPWKKARELITLRSGRRQRRSRNGRSINGWPLEP